MEETIISREELFALPEYSCSLPTRTAIGKRWRGDVHAYRKHPTPDDQHEWKIGEYVEHPDPNSGMVGIRWTWAVDENHNPHRGKLFQCQ
jgi:hypothetical protein